MTAARSLLDRGSLEAYFLVVNRLPIHLHHHVYWIVPLLVAGVILLVYWALSPQDDYRGPQL